jgi:tetratricopeptide (TPR) repeat protein
MSRTLVTLSQLTAAMASLIPGYEYDIFISYRQKDNKGDRWVSEFVEALKTELESTFKEEISVYFDINPHDGLLETHDVDASLKEKLKCLVFMPIISRTYCDPKSFAWEHEFKVFVEYASKDQFGLKVKLPNGNVANRLLPVRIYDVDNADIKLCESVLGGVLRGVEFIYTEPGVNRPLRQRDDDVTHITKQIIYRDQINKVGNAIKEIISGLVIEPVEPGKEKIQRREPLEEVKKEKNKEDQEKPAKASYRKIISIVAVFALILIAAVFVYPKIFKTDTLAKLKSSGERISIVVMPFQNMTNDTSWNVWQDGIQFNIISSLSNNSDELKVSQTESINNLIKSRGLTNYASITPSIAGSISRKLEANIFIYGNVNQVGKIVRVNAQIIDTKTEEAIKSFQIDGSTDNILNTLDSLSLMIKDFLIISKLGRDLPTGFQHYSTTNSPDAFKFFIYGTNAFLKADFATARNMFTQSLSADSNFILAYMQLAFAYGNAGIYDQAKKWCLKFYGKKDQMSQQMRIYANFTHARFFETPYEEIKYLRQQLDFIDQSAVTYWNIGNAYTRLGQHDKAIPEYEKTLKIFNDWDSKPIWAFCYTFLGSEYHETGQYKKEKKLYRKAEQDFPDDPYLFYRKAVLALTEGNTDESNGYIEKYISLRKETRNSEAEIAINLAGIYSEAGIPDKSEEYYRKALSLQSESQLAMNNLAYFLIDKNRNVTEGMELTEKALRLNPEDYDLLDTKGWGLYKQGRYQEARDVLQKSWDLRRQYADYNHSAFLHLEAAKKAVFDQKRIN